MQKFGRDLMAPVNVFYLPGYQSYTQLLDVQHQLHGLRVSQHIDDTVLVLEHAPVITIGRTPQARKHVCASEESLRQQGIDMCVTDRGGDVTYHGPGQITVYYIMELAEHDIHRFVQRLEQSVITLLADYGIQGYVNPEYPGVWVGDDKICALGVAVRKWVSFHGIALNISPDLTHFQYIVPCGIHEKGVTSLQQQVSAGVLKPPYDIEEVKRAYIQRFAETFHRVVYEKAPEDLRHLVPEDP